MTHAQAVASDSHFRDLHRPASSHAAHRPARRTAPSHAGALRFTARGGRP